MDSRGLFIAEWSSSLSVKAADKYTRAVNAGGGVKRPRWRITDLAGRADGTTSGFSRSDRHSTKCLRGRLKTLELNQNNLICLSRSLITFADVLSSRPHRTDVSRVSRRRKRRRVLILIRLLALSFRYSPSQVAKSRKVTRLLCSWSRRVKVRFASVSACCLETPGHGASSPYKLLN